MADLRIVIDTGVAVSAVLVESSKRGFHASAAMSGG
jgi:hypothetical protein